MRFNVIIASLALICPSTLADFHVVGEVLPTPNGAGIPSIKERILPSNKYNCGSLGKYGDVVQGRTTDSWFQSKGNTCGKQVLNFYKRSDGHWQVYEDKGDGSVQAECYNNGGGLKGCSDEVFEELVCYSYLCK